MPSMTQKDLAGILVVSVEQAVAAPYLTSRLADAGARVIKVERPEGDFARSYDALVHGESAYFVWLNRGKESICLDLKTPGDAALMKAPSCFTPCNAALRWAMSRSSAERSW